jgi:hypothetical protein
MDYRFHLDLHRRADSAFLITLDHLPTSYLNQATQFLIYAKSPDIYCLGFLMLKTFSNIHPSSTGTNAQWRIHVFSRTAICLVAFETALLLLLILLLNIAQQCYYCASGTQACQTIKL